MAGQLLRKAGGFRKQNMLLVNLSTISTALSLSIDEQDSYLNWGGQSSAARITLPQPEEGLFYQIYLTGPAVSTATKFLSSANTPDGRSVDIVTGGTSAKGVAFATTVENGASIQFLGLNDRRWMALRGPGSTVAITSTTT